MKKLNCVELFAGAGGLGKGFSDAGFNIVVANDIWPVVEDTYLSNFPNSKFITKDISLLTGKELLQDTGLSNNDIDVIIGGPPCQGFSTLGKRFIDDPRNKLFKDYIRIVGEIKPKVFVMENVSGIMNMQKGKVLQEILKSFNEIGYKVEVQLLNAANYGVPQTRTRAIFIGTRLNTEIIFPEPTINSAVDMLSLWDAISDLPQDDEKELNEYAIPPQNNYQKIMRKNTEKLELHIPSKHGENSRKMMTFIPTGKSVWEVENIPENLKPKSGYGNTYARLDPTEPGMTITRNFSCISSSRCIHPYLNRGLTAREAARIQSFPDDYKFSGSKTDIHLQIGNSVPPILAYNIAETIKKMLTDAK